MSRAIASLLEREPRAPSPPDHLCGLGYSPSDPRQTHDETAVLVHAERALNMVQSYCEIRDSWTGWLRSAAMGRTLYERLMPELRDLQAAERRIIGTPSVCLLSVLDYAKRARRAVPAYTPREGIDYPQPILPDAVREACERLTAEAAEAEAEAKRAAARAYAARMAAAIEREREGEARRQRAMVECGVTEPPDEAARAQAALEARIAVYQRELDRASAPSSSEAIGRQQNHDAIGRPKNPAPLLALQLETAHTVAWRIVARRGRFPRAFRRDAQRLEATPRTVPPFANRLVLIDRGARGGVLVAHGGFELDGRRETINGVIVQFAHRSGERYRALLTPGLVVALRAGA